MSLKPESLKQPQMPVRLDVWGAPKCRHVLVTQQSRFDGTRSSTSCGHLSDESFLISSFVRPAIPNPDVIYSFTWWKLAEDEVVVVDFVPPTTDYWALQLCDRWYQCFPDRRSNINNREAVANADGSVRILISDGDPGVPNWLDTSGHRVGVMFFRWLHADIAEQPVCRVVKRSEIGSLSSSD
jgi:hypothetical protein